MHRGAKVIVEVPEECMIVFTNDTFHVDVKVYAKYGGNYLSRIRLFAYIVDDKCTSIDESIEFFFKINKIWKKLYNLWFIEEW